MTNRQMELLAICTAYEQGYGQGFGKSEGEHVVNPYKGDEDLVWCWEYGFSSGEESRALKNEIDAKK